MTKRLLCLVLMAFVTYNFPGRTSYATSTSTHVDTHYALLDERGQAVLPDASSLCWASAEGLFFLDVNLKPSLFHWKLGEQEVRLVKETPLDSLGRWRTIEQERSDYPRDEAIIFSLVDGLYGLILSTGEIKRLDVQTGDWACVGMLLIEDGTINALDADTIKDVARDESSIYFLIDSAGDTTLVQLELSTGITKTISDIHFDQIEPYTPGTLLVSTEGTLHVFDPHARVLGGALVAVDPLSSTFAYDQAADRLLFIHDGDVYQKSKDKPMEMIRATEIRSANPSWDEEVQNVYGNAPVSFLLPLWDGFIAYHTSKLPYESAWGDPSDFLYVVNHEPIVGAIETLHIESGTSVATAFYQLMHPNVRIEKCIVDSEEADHFPDVFSRSTKARNTHPQYARELVDLSHSPIISKMMSQYDSMIFEAVCEGDKVIGLPWSISLNTLDYDRKKWESIGLPDPPKTVDELFGLIQLWDEQYADQYPDQPLLGNGAFFDLRYGAWTAVTEAYISKYASNDAPVDFDTEEYRMLVQRIMDMPDVEYAEWGVLLRFFMAFYPLYYPFTELDWKDGYTEYTSIPPLKLSDAQALRVDSTLYYFSVAKNAQSPELALDYVVFLAEFLMAYQPEIDFMMTGDVGQISDGYDDNLSFRSLPFVGMTSEGLSVLPHEAPGGFISNESLDFYRSIFPALDFNIAADNPAYAWGDPGMRLPWPTDKPDGDLVCTIDELIVKMNEISERDFAQ